MNKINKKGMTPEMVGAWSIGIVTVIFSLVVFAIMLGSLQTDLVTGAAGCNSTVTSGCGYDYNITSRGLTFLDNATDKFGTAGTILGVLVLLGVIGLAGFGGYQAYKRANN